MSTRRPEGFGPRWLAARLAQLLPDQRPRRLLLACSGGVDSMALLALAASLPRRQWQVRALHVHHHLQSAADAAANLCREECRRLGLPLRVVHLRLGSLRGESVEAVAREARYAAARRALGGGEVLLTAHHDDDQLETVLLQLLRGAGVAGLAGMPVLAPFGRGWHARPLLGVERATIECWARAAALRWIDDASNADTRFDRNYLRLEVLPALRARWPAAARVVARSAAHLAEAHELLTQLAHEDMRSVAIAGALDLEALACLTVPRQRNLLRVWLGAAGLRAPDTSRLERVRSEMRQARADANPVVSWTGGSVRRHRGLLYAVPELPPPPVAAVWHWRQRAEFELGAGLGRLRLVEDRHGPLALATLPAVLGVGPRQGGEQLRLERDAPRRALKDLLREAGVLPWWRALLPVVRAPGGVVAVADLWCDAAYRATSRTRRRARLEWVEAPVSRAGAAADQPHRVARQPRESRRRR